MPCFPGAATEWGEVLGTSAERAANPGEPRVDPRAAGVREPAAARAVHSDARTLRLPAQGGDMQASDITLLTPCHYPPRAQAFACLREFSLL